MRKQRHDTAHIVNCPMEATLDLIGGKWKSVILFRLTEGTLRFNELNRLLARISPRTLTKQLRELERDGLIRRTVYAEVPPRVEYDLTTLGHTLEPVLAVLMNWGRSHALPTADANGDAAPDGDHAGDISKPTA